MSWNGHGNKSVNPESYQPIATDFINSLKQSLGEVTVSMERHEESQQDSGMLPLAELMSRHLENTQAQVLTGAISSMQHVWGK